jgi:ABC-2 type transport system permease protein
MKKMLSSKFWWLYVLIILLLINYAAALVHARADLTQEKRYTLSAPTKKLLNGLQGKINITVFLAGDLKADFKKLANSTNELLQDFKEQGRGNIYFHFQKAGAGLTDTAQAQYLDTLAQLGIRPYTVNAQLKEGATEERQVVPGALVSYKNRKVGVNLLSGQSAMLDEGTINRTEALLEYKFADAVRQVTQDSVPLIGYIIGNGEPMSYNVYQFVQSLKQQYAFRFFPIDSFPTIPGVFSAMIVLKPTQAFTSEQKLKIDQYVMNGGKMLWMIDNLYAEMDSLQRSQNDFIAFDRGLNLEDQLFKYGVRINLDLVQDLNCDKIPSVVGTSGDKPQMELLPWPYFPLLSSYTNHPIAKNLDYVLSQFPNSIDTVKADGVKKTILLATSAEARSLTTPAKVSWNSIQNEADLKTFNKPNIPIAVLLEGSFRSLYANRVTSQQKAMMDAAGQRFAATSPATKMIVIADADIAFNPLSQTEGPLALGINRYTQYQYANKDFLMNAVEYLVDNTGILETRSKDFTLRLLDKKKVEEQKNKWQVINVIVPVLLIVLFGLLYQWFRKRKYQKVT